MERIFYEKEPLFSIYRCHLRFDAADCSFNVAGRRVYTCKLNRQYKHPVTGVIEDTGGESAFATGQGMVEGCTYDYALL